MRTEKAVVSKNEIIAVLTKSPHGKLDEYEALGRQAAAAEPEFLAHLIAWNATNGQIRDSKIALPVISLAVEQFNDGELMENSWAHIASLDPIMMTKALRFAKQIKLPGRMREMWRLVGHYLRYREQNWGLWTRTALQYRGALKELYSLAHVKPSPTAAQILFANGSPKGSPHVYPKGSVFEVVARLKDMSPTEAASSIIEYQIPFLVAKGALGKTKGTDIAMALIGRMSPTELVTNATMLEKWGTKNDPVLREALREALAKASTSKKATLKTSRAAKAVQDDGLRASLQSVQEKQLDTIGSVDGNWLVCGDKSGSMSQAIDKAREVAAVLTRMVKGQVHLLFFDYEPRYVEATGKSLEEITKLTRLIKAGGGTNMGCTMVYAKDRKLELDGVAIISDGGENQSPTFASAYSAYAKAMDREPSVYLYHVPGDPDKLSASMGAANIPMTKFDASKVDYYSLPNLVKTMRVGRYTLLDEIMAVRLLTRASVFTKKPKGARV